MMLEVRDLNAYYGKSHILHGVNFTLEEGEVVSLLGRNGVGRSTTVKSIMGEVPPHGSIRFRGNEIAGLPNHKISRLGLGYVPENRDIFPTLTVRQNLELGVKNPRKPGKWRAEQMLEMFPNLAQRADAPAGVLSGGEKQMLTISRTLMGDPELIMIDEPTEGLAPLIVKQIGDLISEIAASLYRYTDRLYSFVELNPEVVRAHADAMRAVIKNKVKGDGGDIGVDLVKSLDALVERMSG